MSDTNDIVIEDDNVAIYDLHHNDVVVLKNDRACDLHPELGEQHGDLIEAKDALAHFINPEPLPDVDVVANADASTAPEATASIDHVPRDVDAPYPSAMASMSQETADEPDTHLARIEVINGKVGEAISAVEALLAATGRYYQRNGQVVELRTAADGVGCDVKVVTIESLQVALASMSEWQRFSARNGTWQPCDPDARVCRLLLNGSDLKQLKPLKSAASQPHLRPDGSLCLAPGYDDDTGIFGAFDAHTIAVDPNPGIEAARAALAELEDLLVEVAFATDQDKSAALAAILTAAVRPSLPHAPLFHVTAHQPGSGKSYLCDLIAQFAGPKPSSKASFPTSNEECGKLLLSQLMRSPAVIEFDNLTMNIKPYDKLCSALTTEMIEGRVLSTSSTMGVSTRTLFLSSGNNVKPINDMLRRTMVIHLDPMVETPSARTFARPNLLADLRRDRSRYVTAALTVVRAWLASGAASVECRPLGSFGEWSKWCRESLIWLGCEDPAAGLFEALESDPEKLLLGRVLEGWNARYGASATMVRNVVPAAMRMEADDDFREALIEASGGNDSVNVRKLGHWLAHQQGRIVRGLRLVKARKTGSAQNWCVESVTA